MPGKRNQKKQKDFTEMKKRDEKYLFIPLLIVFLDQLFKNLFLKYFPEKVTTNTGILFGLFRGYNFVFIIFNLVVILIILLVYFRYLKNKLSQICLLMVWGGAISNLIDRVFHQAVIDYINLKIWPSFNLADLSITLAVIILIVWQFKKRNKFFIKLKI